MPTARNLDAALAAERAQLADRLWAAMRWFALLGGAVSVSRAFSTGWIPLYAFHLLLVLAVWLIYAARRFLSTEWKAALLIGFCWTVGLLGLLTFGMAAPGVFWLVLSIPIAGVYFPRRSATAISALVLLLIVCGALLFIFGWRQFPVDADAYLRDPFAWANFVVGTIGFALMLQAFLSAHQRATQALLQQVIRQQHEIEQLTSTDQLTGLLLQPLARSRMQQLLDNAPEVRRALLYIDLDDFREVSKQFGFETGERFLHELAARMERVAGSESCATRCAGSHFLLLSAPLDPHPAAVMALAEALLAALELPLRVDTQSVQIHARLGLALFPEHAAALDTLEALAIDACRIAQRNPGFPYVICAQPAD